MSVEREAVVKYAHQRPFRPAVVLCDNGQRFVLRTPEHFTVGSTILFLVDSRGEDHIVSLESITSIAWLRNGRRRTPSRH